MHTSIDAALDQLLSTGAESHLRKLQRGLEKESLRVDAYGVIAQSPHPQALGAALTHPSITTDYSESLLEFVTGVHTQIDDLLDELHDIHHFTYQHINDEKLWVNSMPCIVESENHIPIARYGASNIARMKEVYRTGLSYRYGSLMQTIAGIHYNFSFPESFWTAYFPLDSKARRQEKVSDAYFRLIRNFHRYSWLGTYLFGASPAVCRSFLHDRQHTLKDFDAHSFYAPYATSLRLSRLGYSNESQSHIHICYNSAEDFVRSLRTAIQTPHPEYEKIGVYVNDEYRQLNSNLLQIENEFYSSIRPKRVAASGQSPSRALYREGVQYIEIRSIDLNPFSRIGIDHDCIRFFDCFLIYCLLLDSPDMSIEEFASCQRNQQEVVMRGRSDDAAVLSNGKTFPLRDCLDKLLSEMEQVARVLDDQYGGRDYADTIAEQRSKVAEPSATPSARILHSMFAQGTSFHEFAMSAAAATEDYFKQLQMSPDKLARFADMSEASHKKRAGIEAADTQTFEQFLESYFARQNADLDESADQQQNTCAPPSPQRTYRE